jgi:hypothetical protein
METISLVWIEPGGVFLLLGLHLPEGRTNPDEEGGESNYSKKAYLTLPAPALASA